MTNLLKYGLAFVGGALTGAAVTYAVVKQRIEKKLEAEAQQAINKYAKEIEGEFQAQLDKEIDQAANYLHDEYQKKFNEEVNAFVNSFAGEPVTSKESLKEASSIDDFKDFVEEDATRSDYNKKFEKPETEPVYDIHNPDMIPQPGDIYVIDESEYGKNIDGSPRETRQIEYFDGDCQFGDYMTGEVTYEVSVDYFSSAFQLDRDYAEEVFIRDTVMGCDWHIFISSDCSGFDELYNTPETDPETFM